MPIEKFWFENIRSGWKLNEIKFSDLNLLVGQSGVGKTKILDAINIVRKSCTSILLGSNDIQWSIDISVNDTLYRWSAHRGIPYEIRRDLKPDIRYVGPPHFQQEIVTMIVGGHSETIIERDEEGVIFQGQKLPKIPYSQSVVDMFSREDSIAPLFTFMKRTVFSEETKWDSVLVDDEFLESRRQQLNSFEKLCEDDFDPLALKALFLQEHYQPAFEKIQEVYMEIFPNVTDIKIGKISEFLRVQRGPGLSSDDPITVAIKEKGIDDWIISNNLSSGMLRVWVLLVEMALSPPGTLLMIDEIENSMGINCLSQITDCILRRTDLQFIITSHHPYIINNIPWKYWKLVTRKGSDVTVKDAAEIPALNSASSLEKFTQLMNLEEYEEAIG